MKIKFVNLNMWIGGKLMDNLIEFLKEEDADIVSLQEVNDEHDASLPANFCSMDVLAKELHYPHMIFAPAFIQAEEQAAVMTGNAVLSKFPLKEEESVFYDIPFGIRREKSPQAFAQTPRNLQHVVADLGSEGLLHIYNTQGIWGEDDQDNERRLRMGQMIAGSVQGKDRVILSGDFNVDAHSQTIGYIDTYLTDVFKGDMKTSFNMRIKKGGTFNRSVVDMVFTSPDIHIVEKKCPDIDVSDHLPQVCMFEI